jgi:hypothetical protein
MQLRVGDKPVLLSGGKNPKSISKRRYSGFTSNQKVIGHIDGTTETQIAFTHRDQRFKFSIELSESLGNCKLSRVWFLLYGSHASTHFKGNTSPNVTDGAMCHDPALVLNTLAPETLA